MNDLLNGAHGDVVVDDFSTDPRRAAAAPITLDALKTCHMRLKVHLRRSGGSTYVYACVEHPRLEKVVVHISKERRLEETWLVDGDPVADLAAAAATLNAPVEAAGP